MNIKDISDMDKAIILTNSLPGIYETTIELMQQANCVQDYNHVISTLQNKEAKLKSNGGETSEKVLSTTIIQGRGQGRYIFLKEDEDMESIIKQIIQDKIYHKETIFLKRKLMVLRA